MPFPTAPRVCSDLLYLLRVLRGVGSERRSRETLIQSGDGGLPGVHAGTDAAGWSQEILMQSVSITLG